MADPNPDTVETGPHVGRHVVAPVEDAPAPRRPRSECLIRRHARPVHKQHAVSKGCPVRGRAADIKIGWQVEAAGVLVVRGGDPRGAVPVVMLVKQRRKE